MPKDDDAKLAGIELKDRSAEERAILDVACAVRAIHFRRARWNQGVAGHEGIGHSQILLKMRENIEYDREFLEDTEPDWKYVTWYNNKVQLVKKARDIDSTCQATLADGSLSHAMYV